MSSKLLTLAAFLLAALVLHLVSMMFNQNASLSYYLRQPSIHSVNSSRSIQVEDLQKSIDDLMQIKNSLLAQTIAVQESLERAGKSNNVESIGDIMKRTGTDKYSIHHYDQSYAGWMEPFRGKEKLKFLEIGANEGHSLALWAEYFDHPELIVGLAYGKAADGIDQKISSANFVNKNRDKLRVVWGDQSTNETMDELCNMGPWDIIVDDGSHVPAHVMFSFVKLFPCLVPGGMYIVEDLETSYWDKAPQIYGYKLPGVGIGASARYNAVEKFKQLIDVMNRHEICRDDLSFLPGDEHICSMDFSANVIKIVRCTERQAEERKDQCKNGLKKRSVSIKSVNDWMANAKSSNLEFNSLI